MSDVTVVSQSSRRASQSELPSEEEVFETPQEFPEPPLVEYSGGIVEENVEVTAVPVRETVEVTTEPEVENVEEVAVESFSEPVDVLTEPVEETVEEVTAEPVEEQSQPPAVASQTTLTPEQLAEYERIR